MSTEPRTFLQRIGDYQTKPWQVVLLRMVFAVIGGFIAIAVIKWAGWPAYVLLMGGLFWLSVRQERKTRR